MTGNQEMVAVTKLVAKPMLSVFFPELRNFEAASEWRNMCKDKSMEGITHKDRTATRWLGN